MPTHASKGPEVGITNIIRAIERVVGESPVTLQGVTGIGLATPGTMDIPEGMLLTPHNLPGWNNFPIRQRITDHFGIPTVLQNDANAAAYGEFWSGAAKNYDSVAFWTLGTGIGCGIILGDFIVEGAHSHGAECGHIVIEMINGRRCDTGQYGTVEAYASAKSLVRRCEESLRSGRASVLREWLADGQELTPLLIAQAAEAGDGFADKLVMNTARYLGVATTTLMHTVNPAAILLGGAMTFGEHNSELGQRFLETVKDEVKRRAFPVPAEKTVIDYATLGGDAGFIGAAGCARLAIKQGHRVSQPVAT